MHVIPECIWFCEKYHAFWFFFYSVSTISIVQKLTEIILTYEQDESLESTCKFVYLGFNILAVPITNKSMQLTY